MPANEKTYPGVGRGNWEGESREGYPGGRYGNDRIYYIEGILSEDAVMKRRNHLQHSMLRFAYDHRDMDVRFRKLRKSAEEAAKTLENLGGKKQKEEEK